MNASLSESVVTFRASLQVVQQIQESGMYQLPDVVGTYVDTVQDCIRRIEGSSLLRTAAVPHRAAITARKRTARNILREVHARPLCTMARVMENSVTGMVKLFHMPYDHLNDRNFLEGMLAIVEDAKPYRDVFINKGCPPDFLERFTAAIDDFLALLEEQRLNLQYRSGARGNQCQAVKEGKGALLYLDAVLSPLLYDDPRLLSGWRQACFPNRRLAGTHNRRLLSPDVMKALPSSSQNPTSEHHLLASSSGQPAGRVARWLLKRA